MRTARRVLVCGLLLLTISTLSCGPAARRTEPAPIPPLPAGMPHAEFGQLQVFTTSQTTDGRNIKLRGLVRNPYPEATQGVRLIYRVLTRPGPDGKELDRFQKVLDSKLSSGAQTPLSWDLQTMYAGQSGTWGFNLQAFAIQRGDRALPLPPDWKE